MLKTIIFTYNIISRLLLYLYLSLYPIFLFFFSRASQCVCTYYIFLSFVLIVFHRFLLLVIFFSLKRFTCTLPTNSFEAISLLRHNPDLLPPPFISFPRPNLWFYFFNKKRTPCFAPIIHNLERDVNEISFWLKT